MFFITYLVCPTHSENIKKFYDQMHISQYLQVPSRAICILFLSEISSCKICCFFYETLLYSYPNISPNKWGECLLSGYLSSVYQISMDLNQLKKNEDGCKNFLINSTLFCKHLAFLCRCYGQRESNPRCSDGQTKYQQLDGKQNYNQKRTCSSESKNLP